MNTDYKPRQEVIKFFVESQKGGIDIESSCGYSVDSLAHEMQVGTDFGRELYKTTEKLYELSTKHNLPIEESK